MVSTFLLTSQCNYNVTSKSDWSEGGVTPRKLSGTGSVKERERDFAEPGSAGPPPPPRAPAAGAEFLVRGCALPRRPRPARAAPDSALQYPPPTR